MTANSPPNLSWMNQRKKTPRYEIAYEKIANYDKAEFMPSMLEWLSIWVSISEICHIKRWKEKNHLIFLIDSGKTFHRF